MVYIARGETGEGRDSEDNRRQKLVNQASKERKLEMGAIITHQLHARPQVLYCFISFKPYNYPHEGRYCCPCFLGEQLGSELGSLY